MDKSDLERLCRGDNDVHDQCAKVLIWWARSWGLRGPDLEDFVRDVICEALRCASKFSGRASLETWLAGIARNLRASLYRRETRRSAKAQIIYVESPDAAQEVDPEKQAMDSLISGEALSRLSDDERAVLLMRLGGMTVDQVVERLGKTVWDVRRLQYQASKRFQAYREELEG